MPQRSALILLLCGAAVFAAAARYSRFEHYSRLKLNTQPPEWSESIRRILPMHGPLTEFILPAELPDKQGSTVYFPMITLPYTVLALSFFFAHVILYWDGRSTLFQRVCYGFITAGVAVNWVWVFFFTQYDGCKILLERYNYGMLDFCVMYFFTFFIFPVVLRRWIDRLRRAAKVSWHRKQKLGLH